MHINVETDGHFYQVNVHTEVVMKLRGVKLYLKRNYRNLQLQPPTPNKHLTMGDCACYAYDDCGSSSWNSWFNCFLVSSDPL